MDLITLFQDGNGIVAWGIAFLLAFGCTAVVVAVWVQYRRGWPGIVGRRLPSVRNPARPGGVDSPLVMARPEPAPERMDPRSALKAYRNIEQDQVPETVPPTAIVDEGTLSDYLGRLQQAADRLEQLAARRLSTRRNINGPRMS